MTTDMTTAEAQARALEQFAQVVENPVTPDRLDSYTLAMVAAEARHRAAMLRAAARDAA